MRINRYIALCTGVSRRAADQLITAGRVTINGQVPQAGQQVGPQDKVALDGKTLQNSAPLQTIMLNKPPGFVVSRDGQGSQTIYNLLPLELHHLKPVGRLDKESSGLLLLTSDGSLAHQLTHPHYQKEKVYEVTLNKALLPADRRKIERGITLDDGSSKLGLQQLNDDKHWQIVMNEGRNRQIRRTFAALGYNVERLHRTSFGGYTLPHALAHGQHTVV